MGAWNKTRYEELDDAEKTYYDTSQELDISRIPLFNNLGPTVTTLFQGFTNGMYSYVGDELDFYSNNMLEEI